MYGLQFVPFPRYNGNILFICTAMFARANSPGAALFRGEHNAEFGGPVAASTGMMLSVVILFFSDTTDFHPGDNTDGQQGITGRAGR